MFNSLPTLTYPQFHWHYNRLIIVSIIAQIHRLSMVDTGLKHNVLAWTAGRSIIFDWIEFRSRQMKLDDHYLIVKASVGDIN